MNNNYYIAVSAFCLVFLSSQTCAQTNEVSGLHFLYQDDSDRSGLRLSSSGDLDFVLYYSDASTALFDAEGPEDILSQYGIDEGEATTLVNITGGVTPSIRKWYNNKTRLYLGSVFDRGRQELRAEVEVDPQTGEPLEGFAYDKVVHVSKRNRAALRFGLDRVLKRYYFRTFNLEAHCGAALQFGRTKNTVRRDLDYENGDFDYVTRRSTDLNYGVDGYFGLTMRGDMISFGVEVMMVGYQRKSNMGIEEVTFDYNVNGNAEDGTVLITGDSAFESASTASARSSMYQGVRLVAAFHL